MGDITTKFFQNLFASKRATESTHILSGIQVNITETDNDFLLRPFSREEVFKTLNNIRPLKC